MSDRRAQNGERASNLLDTPDAGPVAVRGGAIRVVGYAAGVLLTVGSAAVLFRHLGVDDSGRYLTVLALVAIVTGVTDIGLTTIGVRELAVREGDDRRRLMRDLLGLRLLLACVGVGAAGVFALAVGYDSDMVSGTFLAGIGVIAVTLQSTLSIALMAQLRLGWVTLLDFVRQALLVAGIFTLVAADAGIVAFLALAGPTAAVSLVLTAWVVRDTVPLVPSFDYERCRVLLREVLPFAAATVVAAVYFRASLIVLGLVSDPTETGYFGAAFRVTEVLLIVPNLIVGAAFPILARAARDDHQRLSYGLDRVFSAAIVSGGLVAVALVLGAPFAIDVVAGDEFARSADVLRIQAFALMCSFAATTLFYALLSLRLHRAILVIACSVLVVNVVLAATLGAAHGATGAAYATLASEVVGLAIGFVVLRTSHPSVVPSLGVIPKVAVAGAAAALVALIPGLPSVADALIGSVIYIGVVWAVRAVPSELLEAIRPRGAAEPDA